MPIYFADESIDPVSLQTVPEKYIIFYASVVDGKMWCPVCLGIQQSFNRWLNVLQDCRVVDSLIKEALSGPDSPAALIVYTGNREQ